MGELMLFNAFTPLAGGSLNTYNYGEEYPYDLDGSLDFVRLTKAFSPYPHPSTIGYIDGLVPTFDTMTYSLMMGKTPYGGLIGNNTPLSVVFPEVQGGLTKEGQWK